MCLQGSYVALLSWHNSHVGFYIILVHDVRIMMWPGQISSNLFKLNNQIFDWSGHHRLIAIYAIVLFRRSWFTQSCYFADRDLRDHVILAGPRFKPRAKQYDFLLVLCSIPRPDRLFQASVIHGLCQSPPIWWKNLTGGKKTSWEEKKREVTTLSVRLWWRGRLSIVGI